jgi:hypothetical protein
MSMQFSPSASHNVKGPTDCAQFIAMDGLPLEEEPSLPSSPYPRAPNGKPIQSLGEMGDGYVNEDILQFYGAFYSRPSTRISEKASCSVMRLIGIRKTLKCKTLICKDVTIHVTTSRAYHPY